jgi:hypothetical protein
VLETEVIIAADASEESKSPDQKEDEPVTEEESADPRLAPDTAERPSAPANEVMVAVDSLEESKSPNYKYGSFAYEDSAEQPSVTETPEHLSVIEMEVIIAADGRGLPCLRRTYCGTSFRTGDCSLKQKLVGLLDALELDQ